LHELLDRQEDNEAVLQSCIIEAKSAIGVGRRDGGGTTTRVLETSRNADAKAGRGPTVWSANLATDHR
jgi:hypothetical protein